MIILVNFLHSILTLTYIRLCSRVWCKSCVM